MNEFKTNPVAAMSNGELLCALLGEDGCVVESGSLSALFGFRPDAYLLKEDRVPYAAKMRIEAAKELYLRAVQEGMCESKEVMSSPNAIRSFLRGRLGHLQHESFWCLWLDAQNRLILAEEVASGTVTQAHVYPREILKRALAVNAASVCVAHNHPSGLAEASQADRLLTTNLFKALAMIDVKLVDHFIVGDGSILSFAEQGLI